MYSSPVCVCVCVCVCARAYVCVCVYEYTYVCTYVCVYICIGLQDDVAAGFSTAAGPAWPAGGELLLLQAHLLHTFSKSSLLPALFGSFVLKHRTEVLC